MYRYIESHLYLGLRNKPSLYTCTPNTFFSPTKVIPLLVWFRLRNFQLSYKGMALRPFIRKIFYSR